MLSGQKSFICSTLITNKVEAQTPEPSSGLSYAGPWSWGVDPEHTWTAWLPTGSAGASSLAMGKSVDSQRCLSLPSGKTWRLTLPLLRGSGGMNKYCPLHREPGR